MCVCVWCIPAVVMVCMLRYAQVIEHSHHCWTNTSALVSGCINALGLVMVGNFQVSRREWTCAFSPLYKSKLTSIPLSPSPIFLGRSCQDSSLCGSRCSFPCRLAVCVSAVRSDVPYSRDSAGLLDGSCACGSLSWSSGIACPQYPYHECYYTLCLTWRHWKSVVILYMKIKFRWIHLNMER